MMKTILFNSLKAILFCMVISKIHFSFDDVMIWQQLLKREQVSNPFWLVAVLVTKFSKGLTSVQQKYSATQNFIQCYYLASRHLVTVIIFFRRNLVSLLCPVAIIKAVLFLGFCSNIALKSSNNVVSAKQQGLLC